MRTIEDKLLNELRGLSSVETLKAGRCVDAQLRGSEMLWGVQLSPCRTKWLCGSGYEHAVNADHMWRPNAHAEARAVINAQQGPQS